MIVAIHNVYGWDDKDRIAYFRKLGDCFDFVWDKKAATDLTDDETKSIAEHSAWYLKQYNASYMSILHN